MEEPQTRIVAAAYSGGRNVPSARLRVHQLEGALGCCGVELRMRDALQSPYPPSTGSASRARWAAREVAHRAAQVLQDRRDRPSVTLLQRELLSTVPTLERLLPGPIVFDCDDAVWLPRNGLAAHTIARHADLIVCGNDFLADHFSAFGATIVLPTAVDTTFYKVAHGPCDRPRIGWCGQSSGHRYLDQVAEPLGRVLETVHDAEFVVLSDRKPSLDLPSDRWRFVQWSLATEADVLASLTVGIMPLDNTEWERGKCSYKMLSYLASGIPVVVSPVGMNATVLGEADVGWGPRSIGEWTEALMTCVTDRDQARRRGAAGRALVQQRYSVPVIAERLSNALFDLTSRTHRAT